MVFGAAGAAYLVLHRSGGTPSPAGSSSASAPPPAGPAATVRAYFAAINAHDYLRAWRLGGRNSRSPSYGNFVSGYATTAHDSVTILSMSGDTVTARLTARQTDGTIKIYHGTYTVIHGVITMFNVH